MVPQTTTRQGLKQGRAAGTCYTCLWCYVLQSKSCHAGVHFLAATEPRLDPLALFLVTLPNPQPLAIRHQSTSTPVSELGRP